MQQRILTAFVQATLVRNYDFRRVNSKQEWKCKG